MLTDYAANVSPWNDWLTMDPTWLLIVHDNAVENRIDFDHRTREERRYYGQVSRLSGEGIWERIR